MRRRIIAGVVSLTMGILVPSCGMFEDCGTCEMITEYADGTRERTTPQLLCGEELDEKLDFTPRTVDGNTIWWECY